MLDSYSPTTEVDMETMKFKSPRRDHFIRDEMMDHPKYDRNKYRKHFQRGNYESESI